MSPIECARNHEFVLSCRAAEIRGMIRHSHLQNRFLTWLPSSPDLIRRTYEHGSPARVEFDAALKELTESLGNNDAGFSPIGLLDELTPLRRLSQGGRESMKAAMTRSYASSFHPTTRTAALSAASTEFGSVLDQFLADGGEADALVDGLRAAAERLYQEISALPKGVWLWPEREET